MKEKHECTRCGCSAKFEVAGEWWCAIHMPGHVDSRTAARLAREQYAAELQALKDRALALALDICRSGEWILNADQGDLLDRIGTEYAALQKRKMT